MTDDDSALTRRNMVSSRYNGSATKRCRQLPRWYAYLQVRLWGDEGTMRAIFVQIKCEMGQAYRVAREAADVIPEMSELFSTSGHYDLLGKFYLESNQDIGLFVTEKIQGLVGVKDTYTLITFNAFGGSAS
jgi:DNA-binding Lrp family transcriptional regulator